MRLIFLLLLLLVIAGIFYHYVEHLRWLDSFYFSVVTATTLGFGNITPKTDAGKIFTIFYVFASISFLFSFVNHFSQRTRKKGLFKRFFSEPDKD